MKKITHLQRLFLLTVAALLCFTAYASEGETTVGPSRDYTYKVIGSIGAYNIPDNTMTYTEDNNGFFYYELPEEISVEGSDESIPLAGTVFFYICEVHPNESNVYYGSPSGSPTPITGSNTYGIDTDIKEVEAFYFTVKPGYKYTIRLIGEYITVVKENASPFYLEAGSIDNLQKGVFSPRTGEELRNLDANTVITNIRVNVWDMYALEQPTQISLINEKSLEVKPQDFITFINDKFQKEDKHSHTDGNLWIIDENSYKYPKGEYIYKLEVTVKENNRNTKYTSYSNPFTIKGNDAPDKELLLEGFYLVHDYSSDGQFTEDGSQEESLNGIYYSCDVDENAPLYLITDSNAAQGHSGVLTFEKQAKGTTVDLGDETKYRFTDCVMLRTYAPNRIDYIPNKIVNYRVYMSETEDGEETLIATDDEINYKDSKILNSNLRQPDSDYRLMMIVNDCPLEPRYYRVEMDYRATDNENDEKFITVSSNRCQVGLIFPSPRVKKIYTQFFKGKSDSEASNDAAATTSFYYKDFELKNARFHNLRQHAVMSTPNVTEKLGPKMQEDEGTFSFYCRFLKGDKEDKFSPMISDWKATTSLMKATYLMPDMFDEARFGYESSYTRPVYNRWGDKVLSPIEITLDAPACAESSVVQVRNSELAYNRNNDLMEKFQIFIRLDVDNDNFISYVNEMEENVSDSLIHGTTSQNNEDYFYVTIVDKSKPIDEENDDYEIALDTNGEKAEYVLSRKQLTLDRLGKTVYFNINHGNWYAGQLEEIQENPTFGHLEVRVSYLYPFNLTSVNLGTSSSQPETGSDDVDEETEANEKPAKIVERVSGDANGEVLASDPAKFIFKVDEIVTSVEGIDTDRKGLVTSGKGFIEVADADASIYNMEGVKVAEGAGRHSLKEGIYIVRIRNNNTKVFVL